MALRKQVFDVTTSLPQGNGRFQGSKEENVIRYADRPAYLVGYGFEDDALTGNFEGFCVREVVLDDVVLTGSPVDEVAGDVIFNYVNRPGGRDTVGSGPVFPVVSSPASNDPNAFPTFPIMAHGNDIAETVNHMSPMSVANALAAPIFFNTKMLEVEVFGGGLAANTINVVLYYESAGDYRF